MRSRSVIWFTCIVLAYAAVGCTPSREKLAAANYGALPVSYEDRIRQYFGRSLRDPYSADYRFGVPYKAATDEGSFGHWVYGYAVDVEVNAKNAYGAYTGFQDYKFFFRSDGRMRMCFPDTVETVKRAE